MKKIITLYVLAAMSMVASLALTSCEKFNEVPPQANRTVGENRYKLPSPTPLSENETAEVQAIKAEYQTGTSN